MVTRDAVVLSESWTPDPARKGHQYRLWGRDVCYSDDAGAVMYLIVPGTAFRLYDDGLKKPGS